MVCLLRLVLNLKPRPCIVWSTAGTFILQELLDVGRTPCPSGRPVVREMRHDCSLPEGREEAQFTTPHYSALLGPVNGPLSTEGGPDLTIANG